MTIHQSTTPHDYGGDSITPERSLPNMTSQNIQVTNYVKPPAQEPDTDGLIAILQLFGNPSPSVVEKLKKSWKDKNGKWHDMELDYIGHATLTKWLIETDPNWNWEPIAWDNGRPKIHINNGTAEMWIKLTVLGKTVLGVGTVSADKTDHAKELIGDALRNAGMRLGYALSLWSKSEVWDNHDTPTPPPASEPAPEPDIPKDLKDNPYTWAEVEFATATSLQQLELAARLVRPYLTDEEREQLRPLYLEHKADLEGAKQ